MRQVSSRSFCGRSIATCRRRAASGLADPDLLSPCGRGGDPSRQRWEGEGFAATSEQRREPPHPPRFAGPLPLPHGERVQLFADEPRRALLDERRDALPEISGRASPGLEAAPEIELLVEGGGEAGVKRLLAEGQGRPRLAG